MDSAQYIHCLNVCVLPFLRAMERQGQQPVFQEDGAPAHRSGRTRSWKREYIGIHRMLPEKLWAPNSPDRSLIEHMWAFMKEEISRRNPRTLAGLKKCIIDAWNNVPISYIENMYASQCCRDRLILERNGGYIGN